MPKKKKKGLKKTAKKKPKGPPAERVVKQDLIEAHIWRTGSDPWTREIVRGVSFPKDAAVAQVEVEAQESVEIKPNDWLRVRVAVRRNCIDTDDEVHLHVEKSWEIARGECKRLLEEERRL